MAALRLGINDVFDPLSSFATKALLDDLIGAPVLELPFHEEIEDISWNDHD